MRILRPFVVIPTADGGESTVVTLPGILIDAGMRIVTRRHLNSPFCEHLNRSADECMLHLRIQNQVQPTIGRIFVSAVQSTDYMPSTRL